MYLTRRSYVLLCAIHENAVREDFFQFVDHRNDSRAVAPNITEPILTGRVLGERLLKMLKDLQFDLGRCVDIGVATDGYSLMVSELCGSVSKIRLRATKAVHSPCFNHALNL
ncbi:hypothetical protein HPB48_017792 [Haemaphysalis longicornis]|uniref:DUF4371 domain-containing protein n=1 Tax=Haemaphysalis longicornis TaxID=44386 RepID=A0A9J6FKV4_HAELO|nr:hypothetical protein HPB48_017792 [Haemaphysalis longicornis]